MLKSYYKLSHKKKKSEFGNGNRFVGGLLLLGRVSFEKMKKKKNEEEA